VREDLPVGHLGSGLEWLVVAIAVEAESAAALTARSAFVTFDSSSSILELEMLWGKGSGEVGWMEILGETI